MIGSSSPRSKKGPNKILKISTALTSKDRPGQLSLIMKVSTMDSLDVGQSPGRTVRNVSWEAPSTISDELNGDGLERKLHHVWRKDSKILPKSPKPHATQNIVDHRYRKPKLQKIEYNSSSHQTNTSPSELSDQDSVDQEDEDDNDRTIVVDRGHSSSDSDNTESQETSTLQDIVNRSRPSGRKGLSVLNASPGSIPESSSAVELDDDVISSRAESLHGDDSGSVMVVRRKGFGMVGPFDTDDEDDGLNTPQASEPPHIF